MLAPLLTVTFSSDPAVHTAIEKAAAGSSVFFILHGLREQAEKEEAALKSGTASDSGKILYLELIDAVFSVDGAHIPEYVSPLATIAIVGYFFRRSQPARSGI